MSRQKYGKMDERLEEVMGRKCQNRPYYYWYFALALVVERAGVSCILAEFPE